MSTITVSCRECPFGRSGHREVKGGIPDTLPKVFTWWCELKEDKPVIPNLEVKPDFCPLPLTVKHKDPPRKSR